MSDSLQDSTFERKVNRGGMENPVHLRYMQRVRERQVCLIKVSIPGGTEFGTGVLIGPDSILTNWHVIEHADFSNEGIEVVFDYKTEIGGWNVVDAKCYTLPKDCLLIHSSTEELDFAILRLPEEIGERRGWCVLPQEEHNYEKGGPLAVLQHPQGQPLKQDSDDFQRWSENRFRVRYSTNTDKGSSGSPCFDKRWNPVALHARGTSQYNEGIPVHLIRRCIDSSNICSSLRMGDQQPDLLRAEKPPSNDNSRGSISIDLKNYLPDRFFGREEDVNKVVHGLEQYGHFALVGHGGIGKTAIAAKSILYFVALNPSRVKDGVVSHNFYQEPSTEAMATSIVRAFVDVNETVNKPLESLKSVLSHHKPFIYLEGCENAEDEDLLEIRELIGSCPFLITTREKKQAVGLQFHEVNPIAPEAASDLLCYHADIGLQDDVVGSLCEALGYMPLAVELAGGWIRLNQSSAAELLKILEDEGLSELRLGDRQKRSIPLLLEKTAEHLSDTALDIWAVLGADAPQPISVSVVQNTLELEDYEMRKALGELMNACLVNRFDHLEYGIDDQPHYELKHRLIYTYGGNELSGRLDADKTEALAEYYLSLLVDWDIGKGFHNYLHCNELMLHFVNALNLYERVLGEEHPSTLTRVNNLGELCYRMGEYKKAKPLLEKALEIRRRVLGLEHPDTLVSINNLATLYSRLGEYEKTKPLFEHGLEVRKRVLGGEHPSTLTSMNNLAAFYVSMDEYKKARPLLEKTLEVRERVLGLEHPDTLASMNNLAALYSHMNEYEKARPLFARVMEFYHQILGPEHPDTLTSLVNLAGLLESLNEYEKAEPLYERVLESSERVLGPKHPDTLTCLNNLAFLYERMGVYDRAKPLREKVLEIHERVFGEEHRDTLACVNDLALLCENMGEYGMAKSLRERVLKFCIKKLGKDHPTTKMVDENLSILLEKMNL